MRLIDADEYLEKVCTYKKTGCGSCKLQTACPADEPVVKAIPVDWLMEWQNKHEWEYESFFKMVNGIPKYAIECMLEDWEKENELDKV